MSSYRHVLSHRVSSTLFVSSTISVLGDWIGLAALIILAHKESGNAVDSAAIFAIQGIAAVASTSVFGSLLDRIDRRRGISAGYLIGAVAMALPLFLNGLPPIYAAVAIVGALRPLTAALRHATAGNDLPANLLGPTIALEGATGQLVVALGLLVGGVVAVTIGESAALVLDVATFVFAGVHAMRLPSGRGAEAGRPAWNSAYRTLFEDPATLRLSVLLIASAFVAALPEVLAAGVSQDGWYPAVLAAQSIGTAVGAFALGLGRRFEQPSGLMALSLLSGVMLLGGAAAFDHHVVWLAIANLLFGLGFAFTITARTAFTRRIDPSSLGASVAAIITLLLLAEAAGSIILAALADWQGEHLAYVGAGLVLLATAVISAALPRSSRATP